MNKISLIFLFQFLSFTLFSQDYITFKDGKKMNIKSLTDKCVQAFVDQGQSGTYSNKGKDLCYCWYKNIAKNYTESEFISDVMVAMNFSNSKEEGALNLVQKKKIINSMQDCVTNNPDFIINKKTKNTEAEYKVLAEQHKIELKKGAGVEEFNEFQKLVNIDDYSLCFIKSILKEFTLKEMYNPTKIIQNRILELQESCMLKNARL